ncbi:hypothetical protein [Streptomyces sp. NPDC006355]|uniref:hypothetical protein n=1 Tax=Streptomyces sp. NPDC006355 TaxID=3156758 RepID=UPI0033AF7BE8
MTDPSVHPVKFAQEIADQIGRLSEHLALAPPREAAHILATVLDPDVGVLGRFTTLMGTGSRFAKHHSERGLLPPEVWLAVGRAANELHSIGQDLDEHVEQLDALANPAAPPLPATPTPAASALVVRRRR